MITSIEQFNKETGTCPHVNFLNSCVACQEKQRQWEDATAEVEAIRDGTVYPVDSRIKETQVAVQVMGFPVDALSEGHLDHGLPYPWLHIGVHIPTEKLQSLPVPCAREIALAIMSNFVDQNKQLREKLVTLVDEFNAQRDADPNVQTKIA